MATWSPTLALPGALVPGNLARSSSWNGPTATHGASSSYPASGWTPRPTKAPSGRLHDELRRRDTSSSYHGDLCGYTSGLAAWADACATDALCVTDSRHAALGCCTSGFNNDWDQCLIKTSCVASTAMASCDRDCLGNQFVRKCSDHSSECATFVYDLQTSTVSWVECALERAVVSLKATAKDDPNAQSASYFAITLPYTPSSASGSSAAAGTGSRPTGSTSGAAPTTSGAPIAAIVGGIIGGLAVLGLIVAGALVFLRTKKNSGRDSSGFTQVPNELHSRPGTAAPGASQYPADDKLPVATPPPTYASPGSPYSAGPSPYALPNQQADGQTFYHGYVYPHGQAHELQDTPRPQASELPGVVYARPAEMP